MQCCTAPQNNHLPALCSTITPSLDAQKVTLIVSFYTQLSPKPAGESDTDGLLVSVLDWTRKQGKKGKRKKKKTY